MNCRVGWGSRQSVGLLKVGFAIALAAFAFEARGGGVIGVACAASAYGRGATRNEGHAVVATHRKRFTDMSVAPRTEIQGCRHGAITHWRAALPRAEYPT